MKPKNIIFSEMQKPLVNKVITSLVFTFYFGYVLFFVRIALHYFGIIYFDTDPVFILLWFYLIVPTIASFPYVLSLSQTKEVHFNLERNLYRERLIFGLIGYNKKWNNLPKISYVSTFYQASDNDFEVQLWHGENQNIEVFKGSNWAKIFYLGYQVAKELNVEMYDAIDRDNKYWVDLEKPFNELVKNVS